jgi:hypothetical protein
MWYRKAVEAKEQLVFSSPKYDVQAQTPVVTLSQTISLNLKTPFSPILHRNLVAVVGVIVNAGFLGKLIDDLYPECSYSRSRSQIYGSNYTSSSITRCFLIDESGV